MTVTFKIELYKSNLKVYIKYRFQIRVNTHLRRFASRILKGHVEMGWIAEYFLGAVKEGRRGGGGALGEEFTFSQIKHTQLEYVGTTPTIWHDCLTA